ncbi:hypothetical protein HDV01_005953 [Terramyces sp. JEL0728]|nr:hypothetical protein HDV01_005953 [Terramyces sp. JEL0728]
MTVELKQEQDRPEISKKEPVFQQEVKEEEISQTVDQPEQHEQDPLLLKEQLKWAGTMIKNMKRRKGSHIFHSPVDPTALNIPTYFDVIKHPMDISTVEKKLSSYQSAKEAFDDVELMFNNCYTFNGPDSAVGLMAKELHKWFEKEWEKVPKSLEQVEAKKKRKSDIGLGLREIPPDSRPRRETVHEDGKKRLLSKKSLLDMKFCNHIHREVTRKQYSHFVWPFLTPVDPEAMGIPQYRTIVTRPMDLSTIKKKLDSSEYLSAEDYEEDFRLMLNNCFAFNAVGTEVYNYGKQLESLFNLKWAEKTTFLLQHGESKVRKMSGLDETSDEDDDDEDARHIQMLKSQLVLLNQQLQMLTEKRAKKKKRKSISGPAGAVAPPGLASVKKKSKSKSSDKKSNKKKRPHNDTDDEKMPETDITYEQKRELSDNINILPPEKLPQVFEIIKENTQLQAAEDEEIELDIDSLDKAVLWKLYLFVKKHTRPPKKAKLDDENGTATGGAASSSSESDEDDSDAYNSESPKPPAKVPKKISTFVKGKKPAEPKKQPPVSTLVKKKTASPLPFRTEIGEYTTNTATFISKNPVKSTPHPPMRKPAAPIPAKPKYDSVLDSAWERHESISQTEPVVPEPQPIIEESNVPEPDSEPIAPLEEYVEPAEWLDLQGVSDMMQDFSNEYPEISPSVYQQREEYLEKMVQKVKEMPAEDWPLNIDEYRNESDEEGAYASE